MAWITEIVQSLEGLTLTLVALLSIVVIYALYLRPSRLPPGPTPLPLIGNLWRVLSIQHAGEEITSLSDIYGPVMRLNLGLRMAVILSSYDAIYEAFVTRSHATTGRPFVGKNPTNKDVTTGLIMKDGAVWKSMRRFAMTTLRDFGYGRNLIEEKIVDELSFVEDALSAAPGGLYDGVRTLFTNATSNVICALMFHKRFDYDDEKFQNIIRVLDSVIRRANFLDVTVFLDNFPVFQKQRKRVAEGVRDRLSLFEFMQSEVDDHKVDFDPSNARDFVDVYLKQQGDSKAGVNFTEKDMFTAIIDLFIAGTETTATTLTWALMYMIAFPEIQERCQREIDSIMDGNRLLRLQDMPRMPYIQATMLEVLRYSSLVPLGIPHRTTQDTTIGGYHVPKDTMLMSNIYAVHFDGRRFEAPHVFRPERFLAADGSVTNADQIITFSMGPRVCLGESLARSEFFIFFANLLNHFVFSKADDVILDMTAVPKCATIRQPRPYNVKVTRRNG